MPTNTRRTSPAKAEALDTLVPFEFRGQTFHVPPTTAWPFAALEAFEDGKIAAFLRAVLGAEYAAFRALDLKIADVDEFVEALQGALGIAGN